MAHCAVPSRPNASSRLEVCVAEGWFGERGFTQPVRSDVGRRQESWEGGKDLRLRQLPKDAKGRRAIVKAQLVAPPHSRQVGSKVRRQEFPQGSPALSQRGSFRQPSIADEITHGTPPALPQERVDVQRQSQRAHAQLHTARQTKYCELFSIPLLHTYVLGTSSLPTSRPSDNIQ